MGAEFYKKKIKLLNIIFDIKNPTPSLPTCKIFEHVFPSQNVELHFHMLAGRDLSCN